MSAEDSIAAVEVACPGIQDEHVIALFSFFFFFFFFFAQHRAGVTITKTKEGQKSYMMRLLTVAHRCGWWCRRCPSEFRLICSRRHWSRCCLQHFDYWWGSVIQLEYSRCVIYIDPVFFSLSLFLDSKKAYNVPLVPDSLWKHLASSKPLSDLDGGVSSTATGETEQKSSDKAECVALTATLQLEPKSSTMVGYTLAESAQSEIIFKKIYIFAVCNTIEL